MTRSASTAHRHKPELRTVRSQIRGFTASAYREAILDAAELLFLRKGYHNSKMADLALAVGVSTGTLYNYFESKEVVFASLVERGREEFLSALTAAAASGSAAERLNATVRTALEYIERRGALYALYFQLGALTESDIRRAGGDSAEAGYLAFLDLLRAALTDAAAAGVVRKDVDIELLVGGVAGAVNSRIFSWVRNGRKANLATDATSIIELFLDGARPR
ncbi:MAG TPA: TetR/AcrR family transcriptional regulator [Polyangiaceae bacterium]|nr:TetR/AcrR family transcriptional regulator [Polyangiaceae bacterium]